MTSSEGAGASSGCAVSSKGSSGGAIHGSSRIPASIERPRRFASIEYGEATVCATGMPRSSA